MRIIKQAQMLVGLALLSAAGMAVADVQETVVVVGDAQTALNCGEATPERARWLADKASQDGAYQRAGECYLQAGQQALADQAFVKASVQSKDDTSRRLASNLNDVKAQARQIKQAFQHR
jgi:precorrin isomerase